MPDTVGVLKYYTTDDCSGTPYYVATQVDFSCSASAEDKACGFYTVGTNYVPGIYTCADDRFTAITEAFGDQAFVAYDSFDDASCANYASTLAFAATGECLFTYVNQSHTATIFDDGSVQENAYLDSEDCSTVPTEYAVNIDSLNKQTCLTYGGTTGFVYFTAESLKERESSGLSTGALIGIIVGAVAAVLIIGGLAFWYCRRKRKYNDAAHQEALLEAANAPKGDTLGGYSLQPTLGSNTTQETAWMTQQLSTEGGAALWQDEIIIGARIPREKVTLESLISRGGYGEVYKGRYNEYDVAIKMLLPETRRSLKHVNAFLAEVKMMAALEHSCIVQFVGVAWDSLNDLCVLSEYMSGGDLRTLLVTYEQENHPKGFDYTKIKIAYHIAHALTYLHSLEQPVIHRDLKSKNVLLDDELNAKLTDFGVSREREDRTMTAGVGTSLWMAPEVMMGEKYDDKADMFSFGVMLSELDMHTLPYSHAKENSNTGRKMPDAAILQMVAMGTLRVEFSAGAEDEMVSLGLSLVSPDPKDRPSAPEALYKLQKILQGL